MASAKDLSSSLISKSAIMTLAHRKVHLTRIALASLLVVILLLQLFHASDSPFASPRAWFSPTSARIKTPEQEPVVELDGIPLGKPFARSPVIKSCAEITGEDPVEVLTDALLKRYETLGAAVNHPSCSLSTARYEDTLFSNKSTPGSTDRRISIALNLYNSEEILPSLSIALVRTIAALKSDHEVYISIFENDSTDKTIPMLGELAAALVALDIDGLFFRHSVLRRADVERIVALADMRNAAIAPLLPTAADGILLFVNDVVTCASDLLELVHQLRLQDAHAVMSHDFFTEGTGEGETPSAHFRDVWVARGINGDFVYPFEGARGYTPQAPTGDWITDMYATQEGWIHDRWLAGLPVPVYSGWNGAIAFNATLFTQEHVRFRSSGVGGYSLGVPAGTLGRWGELIAAEGYLENDCAASECKLFAQDVWNLAGGLARFVAAPQSRTAYSVGDFEVVQARCPKMRISGKGGVEERIDWGLVRMPESVVCAPNLNADGNTWDLWGNDHDRTHKDPRSPEWYKWANNTTV